MFRIELGIPNDWSLSLSLCVLGVPQQEFKSCSPRWLSPPHPKTMFQVTGGKASRLLFLLLLLLLGEAAEADEARAP